MSSHEERPPAFEFKVAARAGEICFRVVGDPQVRTEGVSYVEERQRDGLPSPILPNVRYKDVRVSAHITAWLDDARQPADLPASETAPPRAAVRDE
jgi:hypothetical protein